MSSDEQVSGERAESGEPGANPRPKIVVSPHAGSAHDPTGHEQRPEEKPAHNKRHADPDHA